MISSRERTTKTAKPFVLQFCSSPKYMGGVFTYINNIINSKLSDYYNFDTCFYPRPTRGVSPGVILHLASRFRTLQPDLLHLHGLQTSCFHAAAAARLAGCRRILLTVHGFIEDLKFRSSWRQRLIRDILEPYTLRSADAVYCVSAYGAAKPVIARHSRRVLGHISNAIPLRDPDPPAPGLRASLGFAPGDIVALCISRLSKEKGIIDFRRAFALLQSRRVAMPKLLLVGDGPDAGPIAEAMRPLIRAGLVVMAGERNDVFALHVISDFFVLPTLHEHQSFALLEAMMAGKAILTTRVGGNPELVIDGETGILVPPSDPEALATSLASLASEPDRRARMGQAGRAWVERYFSMPRLVQQVDAIYKELLFS
jgi:glycosyltransferase involved in cell wall biosynthesis